MHILKDIPSVMADRLEQSFGDWRARIQADCPFLRSALAFADNAGLKIDYFEITDKRYGGANPNGKLEIGYSADHNLMTFFEAIGHEIKHHSQFTVNPANLNWWQLQNDLVMSVKSGINQLRREYHLPTPAIAALDRAIGEVDAHTFGFAIRRECGVALHAQHRPGETITSFVNEACGTLADDAELVAGWAYKELEGIERVTAYMLAARDMFDFMPTVRWVPVSLDLIQNSTAALWTEGGVKPPLLSRSMRNQIELMRSGIIDLPKCANIMGEFQQVLKGQTPQRIAEAYKVQL